jgi:hypothetical protein
MPAALWPAPSPPALLHAAAVKRTVMKTQSAPRRTPFFEAILHSLSKLMGKTSANNGPDTRAALSPHENPAKKADHFVDAAQTVPVHPRPACSFEIRTTVTSEALPARAVNGLCSSAPGRESNVASAIRKQRKERPGQRTRSKSKPTGNKPTLFPNLRAVKPASMRCCQRWPSMLVLRLTFWLYAYLHEYANMLLCAPRSTFRTRLTAA